MRVTKTRYLALASVLMAHVLVLGVLLMSTRSFSIAATAHAPIELLVIPPTPPPAPGVVRVNPRRLSGDVAQWIAPLVLTAPSLAPPTTEPEGGTSDSPGTGTGVNWAAEARRAVQAYEIRSRQPPPDNLISGSPADDRWWRKGQHRAGDKFKTPSGDWIVWINTKCYQVATAAQRSYAAAASQPETVCPGDAPP